MNQYFVSSPEILFYTAWVKSRPIHHCKTMSVNVYVGSTNDLKRRVNSHQQGHVTSTKLYIPVALKTYIAVQTEKHARELERYFKSGSGKAFANKRLL
jgi:predicted GIY-YIG superfamily endonuclease